MTENPPESMPELISKILPGGEGLPADPVTIVVDPTDDYTLAHALLAQHAPATGVIVVDPTPGASGLFSLARDLLVALGKQPSPQWDNRLHVHELWAQVTAWVIGYQINDIVILRGHLLGPIRLGRLAVLAADTGAALTVVWHAPPPADWTTVLPSTTLAVLDTAAEHLMRARQDRPPPSPASQPLYCAAITSGESGQALATALAAPLPPLPACNLARFRARLHRDLPPDQFAIADALYTCGMDAACAYLTGQRAYDADRLRDARASQPPEQWFPRAWPARRSLQSFLLSLTVGSPSAAHTITLIRGAQAGFLRHGLLLTVPDDLGHHRGPGFFDVPLTPATAEKIRVHTAHPIRAAALALVLATGMHPDDLDHVRVQHLAADAGTLALFFFARDASDTDIDTGTDDDGDSGDRHWVQLRIPPFARDLFAAARAYVLADGRRDWDPLLLGGFGTHDWLLYQTARDCGLKFTAADHWYSIHYWHTNVTCQWVAAPVHANIHTHPGRQVAVHVPQT